MNKFQNFLIAASITASAFAGCKNDTNDRVVDALNTDRPGVENVKLDYKNPKRIPQNGDVIMVGQDKVSFRKKLDTDSANSLIYGDGLIATIDGEPLTTDRMSKCFDNEDNKSTGSKKRVNNATHTVAQNFGSVAMRNGGVYLGLLYLLKNGFLDTPLGKALSKITNGKVSLTKEGNEGCIPFENTIGEFDLNMSSDTTAQ